METWKVKLLTLLKDKRVTGLGLKLLLLLHASVEYGAFAPVTPAEIARVLRLNFKSLPSLYIHPVSEEYAI